MGNLGFQFGSSDRGSREAQSASCAPRGICSATARFAALGARGRRPQRAPKVGEDAERETADHLCRSEACLARAVSISDFVNVSRQTGRKW